MKKYTSEEAAPVLVRFMERYVDRQRLSKRGLLWNSLKDSVERKCLPFAQAVSLERFRNKGALFLYDERERALYQAEWGEVLRSISALEPWEENVDLLLFDEEMEWFLAVTHEDLLTICGGGSAKE